MNATIAAEIIAVSIVILGQIILMMKWQATTDEKLKRLFERDDLIFHRLDKVDTTMQKLDRDILKIALKHNSVGDEKESI